MDAEIAAIVDEFTAKLRRKQNERRLLDYFAQLTPEEKLDEFERLKQMVAEMRAKNQKPTES